MKLQQQIVLLLMVYIDVHSLNERTSHTLSNHEHTEDEDGGYWDTDEYEKDHESFLGDDEEEFEQLSPEESKRRLGEMVELIDTDENGQVSVDELTNWIQIKQDTHMDNDLERSWKLHKKENDSKMSWGEFHGETYGRENLGVDKLEEGGLYSPKEQKKDIRRWIGADVDKDGELTKKEFKSFLYPATVKHMHNIEILEVIEDIDKNGDGKIDINEYIADIYPVDDDHDEETPDIPQIGEETDKVVKEKETFNNLHDKNKDGFLDQEEVNAWVSPEDDFIHLEAKHLVEMSDKNNDSMLTKDEILESHHVFVASRATLYGVGLTNHDEL